MSEAKAYGTWDTVDGRHVLQFVLSVPYPVERVWQAISTPAELEQFFPAAAPWTPAAGESLDLGGMTLEVTAVESPHRLAWVFAGQEQRFDLVAEGAGTQLSFTHVFDDLPVAQTATGWETYLSRLEPLLAGEPLTEEQAHHDWLYIHDLYAQKFDVDPEPGRQWAAEYLPSSQS